VNVILNSGDSVTLGMEGQYPTRIKILKEASS